VAKHLNYSWALVAAAALLASCGGGDSAPASGGSTTTPISGGGSGATAGNAGGAGNSGGTGSATLSWSVPVENTDGSAISNLAGYRIYHGTSAASLTDVIQVPNPGISLYVVDNLGAGTHYFAITAYNTDALESDQSAVATKVIH
jgi:hypothetical protein